MVEIIFPNIKPLSMLFKNILSMSDFQCAVTLVGVVTEGRTKFVSVVSKNATLSAFASYFSRSILKSPINIIVLTFF